MIHCRSAVGTNLDGNGDFMVDYDYLVLALGVTVNTFNTPGVMEHCHFLKVKSLIGIVCLFTVLLFLMFQS